MTTSTRPRYLTLAQLKRAAACYNFLATFRSLFPSGRVRVSERNARALAQWANFYFLQDYILTPKQQAVFAKALPDGSYGQRVQALRALVPGFDNLGYVAKDQLLDAFRTSARDAHNDRMADAFVLAYNSPKK